MRICAGFMLLGLYGALLAAPAEFEAGAAAVDITPRGPVWMAGFAYRNKPSEAVAAPLKVKALALRDGTGRLWVMVTSDLIGIRRTLAESIAERCLAQYGILRDRLVLNASHQHSGPELGLGGGPVPPEREERQRAVEAYTRELVDRTVGVVGLAVQNLAPATVEFGQGLAGFAVNRRRSRPNTRQFPGPVDQDVPVMAVRAPDGKLRAILFGYSCHPTTNGGYLINADYPGFAQAELEKMHPGAVALFAQGCGADSNPLPRFHSEDPALVQRSLALSQVYGKVLAEAVDATLRGKLAPLGGPIRTAFEYVDIPYETLPAREELKQRAASADLAVKSRAERLLRAIEGGGTAPDRQAYAIQVSQFGNGLRMIALAGEVVVDYALRFKAAYGWESTWVAGYSNDLPGYIPSRRVLLEGGYETGGGAGGAYSTAVEEVIAEKVDALVRRVQH